MLGSFPAWSIMGTSLLFSFLGCPYLCDCVCLSVCLCLQALHKWLLPSPPRSLFSGGLEELEHMTTEWESWPRSGFLLKDHPQFLLCLLLFSPETLVDGGPCWCPHSIDENVSSLEDCIHGLLDLTVCSLIDAAINHTYMLEATAHSSVYHLRLVVFLDHLS